MPQLQPEPERQRDAGYRYRPPSRDLSEWPVTGASAWDDEQPQAAIEEDDAHDADLVEELRRFRHTAAFSGCLAGGARAYSVQVGAGGGGDDGLRIFGAGVWFARDHDGDPLPHLTFKPVVYCHSSLVDADDDQLVLASDHQQLTDYLRMLTGGEEPPDELVAIATSEAAVEDWLPGDRIQGALPGVLGAPCTWNGTACILTAGHVTDGQRTVQLAGATADVKVEFHAGTSPLPLNVGPDFAIIELPSGQSAGHALTPRTSGFQPSETLSIIGGAAGDVVAFATFMRVDQRPGCWGDVLQIDRKLGRPGDSGSPVFDASGQLAGHYLGRLGQRWAIVQDINYLAAELAKAGATIP